MSAAPQPATAATVVAGSAHYRSELLQLGDDVITTHLLPLVSSHVFYVIMPQLCTATRRLLAQCHPHRQQAQRRLSLSDELWSAMQRQGWQLAKDDWRKPMDGWEHMRRKYDDSESELDEEETKDEEEDREANKPARTAEPRSGQTGRAERQHEAGKRRRRREAASRQGGQTKRSKGGERDWSIIAPQLHRRLTRLERLIFRHAPLNCDGERYQLPDAFRALLVDAWTVRLLAEHVPLAMQIHTMLRAHWVVRPCHEVVELPEDCRGRVVSTSELRHLPIVLVLDDDGLGDPHDNWPTHVWWFVAIDCRPAAVDGRQPADLNSAAIFAWRFDPDDYANMHDIDRGTPAVRVWDSAHEFVIDGGIRALRDHEMTEDEKESVERLLPPRNDEQSDDDDAADEEDDEEDEGSEDDSDAEDARLEAVRQYILAPWRRRLERKQGRKRKAERAMKRSKKSKPTGL